MKKFKLLKLVNENSVYGYKYILLSHDDNTTVELCDNHLNVSLQGYNPIDLDNIINDYEVTDISIHLDIFFIIENIKTEYKLNFSDISFIYYFEDNSIAISWGKNESYDEKNITANETLKDRILSLVSDIKKI